MKKWLILLAALVSTFAVSAREQKVRDVDIRVTLHKNGEALIHEKWDVNTGDEITEWYLPRENLGDIEITGFQVLSDGGMLSDDGEWNVDRSRSQKAGRYGIVHKRGGVELCWGVGEYGDHLFEPVYTMSNVVKMLSDYDMLHMQFVTDELAAPPQHVRVTVGLDESLGVRLDTTNCRIWGFGFEGTAAFEDGQVVFESSEPFRYKSSVIALMRFDKGIFDSPSVQDREFQQVLDRALEGADFGPRGDDDDDWMDGLLGLLTLAFLYIFCKKSYRKVTGKVGRREKKQVLGINPKQVGWSRDIPFDGDLVAADYTLTRLGEDRKKNALASAEILRMIYTGHLNVSKDADGKVEISFSDRDTGDMDSVARDLRSMMYEASGDDAVLQDKEFSKWSRKNARRLYNWTEKIRLVGASNLRDRNWMRGSKYTPEGQAQARGLLGFRKFLEDFTLTSEREAVEAHLWQEYLVFGALLGVADKVARQLKDIDPVLFEKTVAYDFVTMQTLINMTNDLARSITNAATQGSPVSSFGGGGGGSWGGFGGGTSFGGGGGFSGGGHGGGGR
ncbi:MAG: DUF2207 domain-containing protein [Bacteroidales bacterium]|nr:DUF2207 domain-containing protein [Bacteroidales bacterium]